jgi:uncharacterized protein (TIGR00251 family)
VKDRPYLSEREGDVLVRVRLQPRAPEIVGERAGALLVRVSAPPLDGRANEALCRLLAKAAGVASRQVSIVKGASARDKVVRLEGVRAEAVGKRLP